MVEDQAPAAAAAPPAPPPARPDRDAALDALRTLAIVLMVASHTTRLVVWDERRAWSRFSLLIEPLTASLFLILVGASLVASLRSALAAGRSRAAWLRRQGIRCLLLWAASAILYTLSEGFLLPDALALSGILATIAYTAAAGSVLAAAPRPAAALAAAAAALAALYLGLEARGLRVFVLNAGNSPLLPLGLFGILGALGAHALAEPGKRGRYLRAGLAAAAVLALGLLLWRHPFQELFSKPVGRYETAREFLVGPPEARRAKTIPYYNLRPVLAPAILSLAVLLYAAFAALRGALARNASWLLRLGRRSLDVYILHLAILAAFVVAGGKRPLKETWQGDAMLLGVLLACYLWAWGREAWRARGARGRIGLRGVP